MGPFAQLLRRARVVVAHHYHYQQPVDAAEIARYVLAEHARRSAVPVGHLRPLVEEAVRTLIHPLR